MTPLSKLEYDLTNLVANQAPVTLTIDTSNDMFNRASKVAWSNLMNKFLDIKMPGNKTSVSRTDDNVCLHATSVAFEVGSFQFLESLLPGVIITQNNEEASGQYGFDAKLELPDEKPILYDCKTTTRKTFQDIKRGKFDTCQKAHLIATGVSASSLLIAFKKEQELFSYNPFEFNRDLGKLKQDLVRNDIYYQLKEKIGGKMIHHDFYKMYHNMPEWQTRLAEIMSKHFKPVENQVMCPILGFTLNK